MGTSDLINERSPLVGSKAHSRVDHITSQATSVIFTASENRQHNDSTASASGNSNTKTVVTGGMKTIGWLASFCLMVNNTTGPAIVNIPQLFQQAGWVSPTIVFLFILVASSFAASLMCEAMARVPGNEFFQGRIELVTLAKHYFPKWGFYVTLILLTVSMQSYNIASIIISAQVMDLTVLAIFQRTCGFEVYPHPGLTCRYTQGAGDSPFGTVFIISIGFILVFMLTIPMGFLNLEDNMWVQVGAVFMFVAILIQWVVSSIMKGFNFSYLPAFGKDQSQVLGTIIFNYTFVSTVPSWANEKRRDVSINGVVWGSTTLSTGIYFLVGIMGALSYDLSSSDDFLNVINSNTTGIMHIFASISVYLFPIVVLLSSIPVLSIIIKYNIVENNLCRPLFANFWAVILPWLISIPFYTGNGLAIVVNYSSLLFGGFTNFVVPLLLYVVAIRQEKKKLKEQAASAEFTARQSIQFGSASGEDDVLGSPVVFSDLIEASDVRNNNNNSSTGYSGDGGADSGSDSDEGDNNDDPERGQKRSFSKKIVKKKQSFVVRSYYRLKAHREKVINSPYRAFPDWKLFKYTDIVAYILIAIFTATIFFVLGLDIWQSPTFQRLIHVH